MTERHAIWFYGADASGKSVVGWEAYRQLVVRGLPAAYVDTDHLGFCDPRPDDPTDLVAANLGAVWRTYADHGIRYLVVSGILVTAVQRRRFADALVGCPLTTVLLRARPDTLRTRIVRRRELEAAEQGTALTHDVRAELRAYGDRSARFAAALAAGDLADQVLDTDSETPARLAADALGRVPLASA